MDMEWTSGSFVVLVVALYALNEEADPKLVVFTIGALLLFAFSTTMIPEVVEHRSQWRARRKSSKNSCQRSTLLLSTAGGRCTPRNRSAPKSLTQWDHLAGDHLASGITSREASRSRSKHVPGEGVPRGQLVRGQRMDDTGMGRLGQAVAAFRGRRGDTQGLHIEVLLVLPREGRAERVFCVGVVTTGCGTCNSAFRSNDRPPVMAVY